MTTTTDNNYLQDIGQINWGSIQFNNSKTIKPISGIVPIIVLQEQTKNI